MNENTMTPTEAEKAAAENARARQHTEAVANNYERGMGDFDRFYVLRVLAALRAAEKERDEAKAELSLMEHKVITCGVIATHSDAALCDKPPYSTKWDSQQAGYVRELRKERDALRARPSRHQISVWIREYAKEDPNEVGLSMVEAWNQASLRAEKAEAELAALRKRESEAREIVQKVRDAVRTRRIALERGTGPFTPERRTAIAEVAGLEEIITALAASANEPSATPPAERADAGAEGATARECPKCFGRGSIVEWPDGHDGEPVFKPCKFCAATQPSAPDAEGRQTL